MNNGNEMNNNINNMNNNMNNMGGFNVNTIPEEYRPISMWGYFGYQLLFCIPCIGFILLLVFAFGGTRNINLRNFARSYFCFLIIVVVLVLLIAIIGGAMFASIA